jgi:hypothetical protein
MYQLFVPIELPSSPKRNGGNEHRVGDGAVSSAGFGVGGNRGSRGGAGINKGHQTTSEDMESKDTKAVLAACSSHLFTELLHSISGQSTSGSGRGKSSPVVPPPLRWILRDPAFSAQPHENADEGLHTGEPVLPFLTHLPSPWHSHT